MKNILSANLRDFAAAFLTDHSHVDPRPCQRKARNACNCRMYNKTGCLLIIRAQAADTSAKRAELTTTRAEVLLTHKSTGTIYHNKDREKVLEGHLCPF